MADTSPPAADAGRRRPDWTGKVVVPVVVAVLGALLVGALTPVGDRLRELLFPTEAFVAGSTAAGAELMLDGKDAGTADEDGSFHFLDVGAGPHVLRVEADGKYPKEFEFVVARETNELELGVIELRPLLELGFYFPLASSTSNISAQTVRYSFTLWIDAEDEVMDRIDSVTYTAPVADPVRSRSVGKRFCYAQEGTVPFDQYFGVRFLPATAVVEMADGQSLEVSAPARVDVVAPDCAAERGRLEGNGGGGPAGPTGPGELSGPTGVTGLTGPTGATAPPTAGTEIVAQGFAFSPDSVTVSAGKVTLTVTNNDATEHTFTLDDGSSSTNLAPGSTVTVKLDLSNAVGWHCNIHPSMTGTLNVG